MPWRLVAGRHRIGAAGLLDWTHIDAIQVADTNADAAVLRKLELSENLDHRRPRPIERAIFIDARARLEEEIDHPGHAGETRQERGARLRWHANNIMSQASNWRLRLADALGCDVRTIERYREVYCNVVAPCSDLAEALNRHRACRKFEAIYGLAKVPNVQSRRKVIDLLLADPELKSIDDAKFKAGVSTSKGGRMPERDRAHAAFLTGWQRMPLAQQRAAAPTFARDLPPTVAEIMAENLRADAARRMLEALKKRTDLQP